MSEKKPLPLVAPFPQTIRKICPVCGRPSYSALGIHPQCAVQQADAPRQQRLAEERKANNKKHSQARSWEKKCRKCGALVPARRKVCDCGYDFSGK